jgi:hypothetical protein
MQARRAFTPVTRSATHSPISHPETQSPDRPLGESLAQPAITHSLNHQMASPLHLITPSPHRMRVVSMCATILMGAALPAAAQYDPPAKPAVGERYNVELSGALWNADPVLVISSTSLGIPGDAVDLVGDLGIEQRRLRELRLVLRPATKHKFRFHYLPITYSAQSVVQREFTFNAQRYRVGVPVNTAASLTTYRAGYEYDFLYRSRGYLGVLFDLKYTDVQVDLASPIGAEFTTAVAPIPTIGVVGRGYVAPNVSITGEVSFFKIPENLGKEDFGGRYIDYDFYGTFNFTNNVGAQFGLRSVDVNYFRNLDTGDLSFRGWYFGAVIRY